jgi:hypothetical protein
MVDYSYKLLYRSGYPAIFCNKQQLVEITQQAYQHHLYVITTSYNMLQDNSDTNSRSGTLWYIV